MLVQQVWMRRTPSVTGPRARQQARTEGKAHDLALIREVYGSVFRKERGADGDNCFEHGDHHSRFPGILLRFGILHHTFNFPQSV